LKSGARPIASTPYSGAAGASCGITANNSRVQRREAAVIGFLETGVFETGLLWFLEKFL
jgi:hypothetical protein